jgi:hypothetical protein
MRAVYINAFVEAKLEIAIRELRKCRRRMSVTSVYSDALSSQIKIQKETPMAKKQVEKQNEALLGTYKQMLEKLKVLSKISARQFLGTRADDDPRLVYLTDLETFKNMANVHIEVIMEFIIKKLKVTREEFLKAQTDLISSQVATMETDLCVTGWDQQGNPLFDLAKYAERTRTWPK